MSEKWLFLAKFLVYATLIYILFFSFGYQAYHQLLGKIAWILYKHKIPSGESITIPIRFYNIVPFLALMFATPNIKLSTRIQLTGLGFFILFLSHILLIVLGHTYSYENLSLFRRNFSSVLNAIGQVAFPFVVWFILAHSYVTKIFKQRKT